MHSKLVYPTIAEVNEASEEQLFAWHNNLPEPETDVERTVHRRINKVCWANSERHLREVSPEAADKLNRLAELMSNVLGTDSREL